MSSTTRMRVFATAKGEGEFTSVIEQAVEQSLENASRFAANDRGRNPAPAAGGSMQKTATPASRLLPRPRRGAQQILLVRRWPSSGKAAASEWFVLRATWPATRAASPALPRAPGKAARPVWLPGLGQQALVRAAGRVSKSVAVRRSVPRG